MNASKYRAALVDSSERYRIETCSRTWPGCSKAPESIGFLNKTCTAGTSSDVYGDTVGPLLRGSGVSSKWRTWIVDVVSKGADSSTVTIKNDFWAARCTNKYIDDYSDTKGACKGTEWSDRVHMHVFAGSGQSGLWRAWIQVVTISSSRKRLRAVLDT